MEQLDRLRSLDDPMEQLRYSAEVLQALQAATAEVGDIRRHALEALRAKGLTLSQIAREVGVSVARLSQIGAPRRRPERALLASADAVQIVLPVEDGETSRPMVHASDTAFGDDIARLAAELGLSADVEHLTVGEYLDLNRDGLVVTSGPRQSPWLNQILGSDSAYGFDHDDDGWFLIDRSSGEQFRSPMDTGQSRDIGYLGALPRPDGKGTWLYIAGIHAPGSRAGAIYLAKHLTDIYRETKGHLWSCLVACDFDRAGQEISNAELIAPVRRRERLRNP